MSALTTMKTVQLGPLLLIVSTSPKGLWGVKSHVENVSAKMPVKIRSLIVTTTLSDVTPPILAPCNGF